MCYHRSMVLSAQTVHATIYTNFLGAYNQALLIRGAVLATPPSHESARVYLLQASQTENCCHLGRPGLATVAPDLLLSAAEDLQARLLPETHFTHGVKEPRMPRVRPCVCREACVEREGAQNWDIRQLQS